VLGCKSSENEQMSRQMMRDLQADYVTSSRYGDFDGMNNAMNSMRSLQTQRAALIEQAARICAYERQTAPDAK
jgi:hypothetical protein